jgi:hypothetical protein
MKASTNKRRRETIYTTKAIAQGTIMKNLLILLSRMTNITIKKKRSRGSRKGIPVRTAEETRHSIASSLEGKSKNHPTQCIPPNTTPTAGIKTIDAPEISLLVCGIKGR